MAWPCIGVRREGLTSVLLLCVGRLLRPSCIRGAARRPRPRHARCAAGRTPRPVLRPAILTCTCVHQSQHSRANCTRKSVTGQQACSERFAHRWAHLGGWRGCQGQGVGALSSPHPSPRVAGSLGGRRSLHKRSQRRAGSAACCGRGGCGRRHGGLPKRGRFAGQCNAAGGLGLEFEGRGVQGTCTPGPGEYLSGLWAPARGAPPLGG